MVITVDITVKGIQGTIRYDEPRKQVQIKHPDGGVCRAIQGYLTAPHTYRIPQSAKIDDFEEVEALPTDNRMYFDLALCTLYTTLGIWVDWNTEKETE
jgi:hypothetical protein